jgi:hypothetical protein
VLDIRECWFPRRKRMFPRIGCAFIEKARPVAANGPCSSTHNAESCCRKSTISQKRRHTLRCSIPIHSPGSQIGPRSLIAHAGTAAAFVRLVGRRTPRTVPSPFVGFARTEFWMDRASPHRCGAPRGGPSRDRARGMPRRRGPRRRDRAYPSSRVTPPEERPRGTGSSCDRGCPRSARL